MTDQPRNGCVQAARGRASDSFLHPLYTRLLWGPLVRRLPRGLSPNHITVLGALACVGTAVALLWRRHFVLAAILHFTYMTCDNVDGAHARRTRRVSALGEFLDHWLDTVNLALLTLGAFISLDIPPRAAVPCAALAVTSVLLHFWEQRVTGRLFFPRFSDVETNTLLVVAYLAATCVVPSAVGLVLAVAVAGGTSVAMGECMRRARLGPVALRLALPAAIVAGWHAAGGLSSSLALLLVAALSPLFTGRLVLDSVGARFGGEPSAPRVPHPWFAAAVVLAPLLGCGDATAVALLATAVGLSARDLARGLWSLPAHPLGDAG